MLLPGGGERRYGGTDCLTGFVLNQANGDWPDRRIACLGIERTMVGGLWPDGKAPVPGVADACLIVLTGGLDRQLQAERQGCAGTSGAIDLHRCVRIAPLVEKPAGRDLASVLKGAVPHQFGIKTAVVGIVDFFGHQPVKLRAYVGFDLRQVDGQRGGLLA